MEISEDYKDLFRILNKYKVKYMIVGAYATIYYAEPRYTKDIDVWIKNDIENAKKVYEALKEFGAPIKDISMNDFTNKNTVYQIGVAPIRVDIMTGLPGVKFENAWINRKKTKYDNIPINIVGLKDLIKSKRKANRAQDKLDLELLQKINRRENVK